MYYVVLVCAVRPRTLSRHARRSEDPPVGAYVNLYICMFTYIYIQLCRSITLADLKSLQSDLLLSADVEGLISGNIRKETAEQMFDQLLGALPVKPLPSEEFPIRKVSPLPDMECACSRARVCLRVCPYLCGLSACLCLCPLSSMFSACLCLFVLCVCVCSRHLCLQRPCVRAYACVCVRKCARCARVKV